MAVQLVFDSANVVATPTIVLAKKGGEKLGSIPAVNINFEDNFNSYNQLDFKVYKERDGVVTRLWDEIKDFRLVWCKEWDAWFEITVDINESDELVKNINAKSISEAELSAIKLYNIEINTEDDIARDDYEPTVLYNGLNHSASLLDRISEKIPHYTIKHVDSSIADIQRVFQFHDTSILNAFYEISSEIGCIFYLSQNSDSNGIPERGIYVYDLENYCEACGNRGEFLKVCPECGSTNIRAGFGEDTSIFVSSDNLADEISLTTDTESVNICFRMETGDELMTAAVASCNPNGSEYLWYISADLKKDMSDSLSDKLTSYDTLYKSYQNDYVSTLNQQKINAYNTLINKYKVYDSSLQTIGNGVGFSNIINILYSSIDFQLYLESGLMPSVGMSGTTATAQASLLSSQTLSPIAVSNITSASGATVDSTVLSFAKAIISPTYKVEVKTSTYNSSTNVWVGTLTITNYSDEDDTADTDSISITVTGDYETFVRQKIEKLLNRGDTEDYSISSLFKKDVSVSNGVYSGTFVNELHKYGLSSLKIFLQSCQSCLDILVEEGIADKDTWDAYSSGTNLYNTFYTPYYNKFAALEAEIAQRENEIEVIQNLYEEAEKERTEIQNALNLKAYLGETLWKEFCAFRRESTYSNQNYISDGLTNAELIERAREFLGIAQKELIKSATLQHSLDSTLKNLLVMKEFEPIVNKFKVGNWIRVRIDDEVYRLRLIGYSIDFDDLDNLNIEFSDVTKCQDDISDIESVLNQAQSMSTTYSGLERQVIKYDDTSKTVKTWFEDGLDATLTKIINQAEGQTMVMDGHGLLMRQYDEISGKYSSEQMRIINSTLAITSDNWETIKTAIGKFIYVDPATGEFKYAFGVNGETIVGKLIIGQALKLYNESNTLSFDENGLNINNGVNTFSVNPSSTNLLKITKKVGNATTNLFYVNDDGDLVIRGNLYFGANNETRILSDGTFNLGNGKIVYDGTNLSIVASSVTIGGDSAATSSSVSTAISTAINDLNTTLTTQIDAKVETWAQSTNPAANWSADEKLKHNGDLWLYTGTSDITVGSTTIHPQGVYQYDASNNSWSAYSSSTDNLFDMVDGKTTIYYGSYYPGIKSRYYSGTSTSSVSASNGDMFYNTSTHVTYMYVGGGWSTFTNSQGYAYHIDSSTNTVRKWDVISTWKMWVSYSTATTGDYFYDEYSGDYSIYIKQSSGWSANYSIENGDYLVSPVNGTTYRWIDAHWVKVTDYKSEIQKFMRFESAYGLMIADMTSGVQSISGATSFNTLLTSTALQIRSGTSVLAEYGSSIKLYQPGTTTALVNITTSGASFNGAVTATTLSTGGKTSSTSTSSGLFIDSSGNLYAGSSNQTQIRANGTIRLGNGALQYNGSTLSIVGNITADTFTAHGAITLSDGTTFGTVVTIGDNIVLTNRTSNGFSTDAGYIALRSTGTGRTIVTYFRDTGITFHDQGTISATGTTTSFTATRFGITNSYDSGIYFPSSVINGSTYTPYAMRVYNGTLYFGTNADTYSDSGMSVNPAETTYIRGTTVRVAGHTAGSGGVFLGTSTNSNVYLVNTSTAVTSDETIKDLKDIDDRYVSFFNNISPTGYTYKDNGHRTHLGFGARAVEKALKDANLTTEDFAGVVIDHDIDLGDEDNPKKYDELYFLRYEEFIALNTMMIKKLQQEIVSLKHQLAVQCA